MGILDLFKKKDEGVPDVGKEEIEEAVVNDVDIPEDKPEEEEDEEEEEKPNKKSGKKGKKSGKNSEKEERKNTGETRSFEIEKLSARLESLNELMKGYSERFSNISQQVGEVRAMTISNEKSILKVSRGSEMAVDIVKEVKPEKLRLDNQKLDARISAFEEKVEANKQFMETIMSELKELRRKSDVFLGTDALLKLNDDVKKDLIGIQKIASMTRVHADKSEQLFIELKSGFAENQKTNETVSRLDASYSGIKKEFEKTKIDFSMIVKSSDFENYKKILNGKFAAMDNALAEVEKGRENDEKLSRMIETLVAMSKKNKEDIADIAMTIGDDKIDRVGDYENQLASILGIIDSLAGQISEVKGKIGMKKEKIFISPSKNKIINGNKKISLQNVEIHKDVSKGLKPGTKEDLLKKAKDFVKKAKEKGYNNQTIIKLFKDKGWNNRDIAKLL